MQIKDVEKLKDWLLKKLEPLCDADPAALAKYVIALLRKDKPRAALKDLCIDQLEVFLAKETSGFVEQLFRGLENDSYLKGVDPPSTESGKPTQNNDTKVPPAPSPVSDRRQSEDQGKRNEVDDEDRDFRRSRRVVSSGSRSNSDSAPVRRVITTATSSTSTGGSSVGLGKKRRMETVQDSQAITRRRIINNHGAADSINGQSNSNSVTSSSTSGQGGGNTTSRRPVKERLGVRADDRSDNRSRRYRRGRNSSSSRSSSSSGSDSDSSSDSDRRSRGRKRKRYSKARSSSTEGRKRQRCKDYDEKGFCILGESCLYDHGVDPLVIGGNDLNPYPPPPPLGLPPPGMPLPSGGRKTDLILPPVMPGVIPPPGGLLKVTDGYNPEDPALSSSKPSEFIPVPIIPQLGPPLRPPPMPGAAIPPPLSMPPVPHQHIPFSTPSAMSRPPPPFHPPYRHPRPPFGGRLLGPSKPSDTLIIRKIPRELNTITKLSSHFEKFGSIVNLKVRYEGDVEGALVQFSSPSEATKAHNSTAAVFNNRFIKVYYLRQNETTKQPPLKEISLETPVSMVVSSICGPPPEPSPRDSSTIVSSSVQSTNITTPPDSSSVAIASNKNKLNTQPITSVSKTSPPHKATSKPLSPPPPVSRRQQRRTAEMTKEYLELQKKTQELLHKQIQQQKLLISKLEKTGKQLPAEEKGKILKTLQTLSTNITKLKEAATATKKRADSAKELTRPSPQQPPAANSLKQKADALRKEAHQLGLINSPSQPLPTGGKGRGRSSQDLRSKLDTKPRKLLVIGVKDRAKLTSYFESFGDLEQVEIDPNNTDNLVFTFRNAYSANKAVKTTSVFNGKPLIMKWYTRKPRQTPAMPTLPTLSVNPVLPHNQDNTTSQTVTKQVSIDNQQVTPVTTPTLVKPDPLELHLVEDSDDDEKDNESRSWKR